MPHIIKMPPNQPHRPHRRTLRYIVLLPTLLTLGNLVCGFAAVHFGLRAMFAAGAGIDASADATLNSEVVERMLPSFLAIGAMLIFCGMLFDMLDGLAARLTKNASEFGAEIDSLADVVTFGVAPAILVIALMMREWHGELIVTPLSTHAYGRAMWVFAAAYCVCTAIRLARYNVEHDKPEFSHRAFRGLPSPGAAAVLASLVTLHEHAGPAVRVGVLYALPIIMLAVAYLMISRIRYDRVTQAYLIRKRPIEHLFAFLVVLVIFMSYKTQTLALLCGAYAFSGPVRSLYRRLRSNGTPSATTMPSAGDAKKNIKHSG